MILLFVLLAHDLAVHRLGRHFRLVKHLGGECLGCIEHTLEVARAVVESDEQGPAVVWRPRAERLDQLRAQQSDGAIYQCLAGVTASDARDSTVRFYFQQGVQVLRRCRLGLPSGFGCFSHQGGRADFGDDHRHCSYV